MNMKNNFSIKRIGLLLRVDFTENKKSLLFYSFAIIAVLILWMWFQPMSAYKLIQKQTITFFALYFVFFFKYCQYTEKKINSRQNNYLMIPSNNGEKFLALFVELFIILWLAIGLFYAAMYLWNILFYSQIQAQCNLHEEITNGDFIILNIFENPENPSDTSVSTAGIYTGVTMALFLLGTFTFKKWAFMISSCIILIGWILIFYFFKDFVQYIAESNINGVVYKNHYTGLLKFIVGHKHLISNLVYLWILYITYLKFTEKEQR